METKKPKLKKEKWNVDKKFFMDILKQQGETLKRMEKLELKFEKGFSTSPILAETPAETPIKDDDSLLQVNFMSLFDKDLVDQANHQGRRDQFQKELLNIMKKYRISNVQAYILKKF